jgi:hypothetical protein
LYLIQNNVPGTYFFFLSEEVGCIGSKNALKNNPKYFSKFNKAVAFDRRGKGSFVRRQGGRSCASNEFADAVIDGFKSQGLEFDKDDAYRTDSAIFMDVIAEITNISSGGEYEHTYMESTDIDYTQKVAIAASKIKWDELPINRIPLPIPSQIIDEIKDESKEFKEISQNIFNKINLLMGAKGFICLNGDSFEPGLVMVYTKWLKDFPVKLIINGDNIKCIEGHKNIGKFRDGDFIEFKRRQKLKTKNFSRSIWIEIRKEMDIDGNISIEKIEKILSKYDLTYDEFKNYMKDQEENQYIEFFEDHIKMDVRILHHGLKKRQKDQEQVLINKNLNKRKIDEIKFVENSSNYILYNEEFNKTRLEKFLKNNSKFKYMAINNLNKISGSWVNNYFTNDINEIFNDNNTNYIYNIELDILYIKK